MAKAYFEPPRFIIETLIAEGDRLTLYQVFTAGARRCRKYKHTPGNFLPMRKGNYLLRGECPDCSTGQTPLHFGMYYSENGQDGWWMNPIVKW